MKSRAAGRNWRLEALAWAGAITLVAAALFFSRGHEEPTEPTPRQPTPGQGAPTSVEAPASGTPSMHP